MTKNIETMSLPKEVIDSEWQDDVAIEDRIEDSFEYYDKEEKYKPSKKVNAEAAQKSIEYIKRHEKVKLGFGKFALSLISDFDQAA